jgi:hypothetical protein
LALFVSLIQRQLSSVANASLDDDNWRDSAEASAFQKLLQGTIGISVIEPTLMVSISSAAINS